MSPSVSFLSRARLQSLEHERSAVLAERRVELRKLAQGGDGSLDDEGEQREAHVVLLRRLGLRLAEGLQLGDVGLVVLGDVRNHHPVAGEISTRQLLDAR
jgi:hypothetical protein